MTHFYKYSQILKFLIRNIEKTLELTNSKYFMNYWKHYEFMLIKYNTKWRFENMLE